MAVDTSVVDNNPKVLEQEVEFDEEEAYFELCQIISFAQQSGNYAKFQNDLNEWKKRYPVESFSEKYKSKIRYLLSEEFLDSILKDYLAFVQYSKLDPSKQLEKFRKIFSKAEQHKDAKRLDADLKAFYKDYPLSYLQEKFPHIVSRLTSKSYREKILQKFDSSTAFEEYEKVIYSPTGYESVSDLETALNPLKEKYPVDDFNDEYRPKIEALLKEDALKKVIESSALNSLVIDDLDDGTVIELQGRDLPNTSGIFNQKTAYFELLEIMKNPNNMNGVFDWTYKYMKYINQFDDYHKGLIISTLAPYYKIPKQNDYRIPIMNSKSHDYLSFREYQSIDDIKKDTILQYIAILSTTGRLTNDDIERLETIHDNSMKAKAVDVVCNEVDVFIEKNDNTLDLTLSDPEYFNVQNANASSSSSSGTSGGGGTTYSTVSLDIQKTDTGVEIDVEEKTEEDSTPPAEVHISNNEYTSNTSMGDEEQQHDIQTSDEGREKHVSFFIPDDDKIDDTPVVSSSEAEQEIDILPTTSGSIYIPEDEHSDLDDELQKPLAPPEQEIQQNFGTIEKKDKDFGIEL